MRNRLYRFMQGRYGSDQLGRALLIFSVILVILSCVFTRRPAVSAILDICGLAGLVIVYYRMLSKQIGKRAEENNRYLAFVSGLRKKAGKEKYMMGQRKQYHIYKCPECGQKIRIPRGLGKKVEISCPKCHNSFVKRS